MASKDPQPRGHAKKWHGTGQLAASGAEIGLTLAALTLLGWWLDSLWNTAPWLTLTAAAVALIGCTYKMLRISASMDDKRKP